MPVSTKKAGTAKFKPASKPKGKPAEEAAVERPVIYPQLEVCGIAIPEEATRVSQEMAQTILGWEDEDEYKARVKGPEGLVGYGEDFLILDEYGKKVRCWNNGRNRALDEAHSNRIAQDILEGEYQLNGETIIVGRTGLSLSAQHRLVGFIRAVQRWKKHPSKYPYWKEEPFLRSLVVFGIDESPKVVKTLDNVRPRSDADVIYTSGIFDKTRDGKPTSTKDKKECSRMLAAATAFLWQRTGAGGTKEERTYQTHSASSDFRERHPKLLEAVKHLFEENQDRAISKLRLSPGVCSAALYLMGSSESNQEKYLKNPGEKQLTWNRWDKACEFWVLLASDGSGDMEEVRKAIIELVDADDLSGGRMTEKMVVLAKAWEAFLLGNKITAEVVSLDSCWTKRDDGTRVLVEAATFGGIDQGPTLRASEVENGGAAADPEREAEERARIRAEHAEEMKTKVGKKGTSVPPEKAPSPRSREDVLMDLRRAHPGKILFFESKDRYKAWASDAKVVAPVAKVLIRSQGGLPGCEVPADKFDEVVKRLVAAKHKVAIVEGSAAGEPTSVRDVGKPSK